MRLHRAAWVALLLAACGGDEAEPSPPGPIPVGQVRAEWLAAHCDARVRCGAEPDAMTCRRSEFASGELLQLVADASQGRVGYDAAAARAWIDAVGLQSCSVHDTAGAAKLEAARKAVFKGKAAVGAPCFVDGECAGSGVCDLGACGGNGGCCAGVCAAAPAPGAPSQPCASGPTPCVAGAYCAGDHCEAKAAEGQACSSSDACNDGQACDQSQTNTCYKLAGSGQACQTALSVGCAGYDQYCNEAGACARLPGDGAPCTAAGVCLGYAACVDGTCKRRPVEGEPCSDACMGDLVCVNGACGRPQIEICAPQ